MTRLTDNERTELPLGMEFHKARAEFDDGGHVLIRNLSFPVGVRLHYGYMAGNTELDEYCVVLGPVKVNVDSKQKRGTALPKPRFSLKLDKPLQLSTSVGLRNAVYLRLERTPEHLR